MKSLLALTTVLFAAAVDAADPAAGTGAAAKPTPPAKPAREKQNGVTRPTAGTATGNVWAIADKISNTNSRPAVRAEVTKAGADAGINPSTVTTQFGQWRRFHGLKKEERVAGEETPKQKEKREAKEAKAAAKAAAKATAVTTDAQVADGNAAAAAAIEESNAAETSVEG